MSNTPEGPQGGGLKARQFRKKPVVIEAFQMTRARRWDNSEWPDWLHEAWQKDPGEGALWVHPNSLMGESLHIGTLEGIHPIAWNDWIIRGIKGDLDFCKPDIFAATYTEGAAPTGDPSSKAELLEAFTEWQTDIQELVEAAKATPELREQAAASERRVDELLARYTATGGPEGIEQVDAAHFLAYAITAFRQVDQPDPEAALRVAPNDSAGGMASYVAKALAANGLTLIRSVAASKGDAGPEGVWSYKADDVGFTVQAPDGLDPDGTLRSNGWFYVPRERADSTEQPERVAPSADTRRRLAGRATWWYR